MKTGHITQILPLQLAIIVLRNKSSLGRGKAIDELSAQVKKALETEMDEAAEERLRTWFIR